MPVVALEQVRLGPAAHFPDQAGGVDWHRVRCKNLFYARAPAMR
jgi:hypothetical protein